MSGARALDAGCGRTTRLANYRDRISELTGVDLDAEGGRENAALDRFVVADLSVSACLFDHGAFDLVYANFVIEHLAEAGGDTKSGGAPCGRAARLVVVTSNRDSPLLKVGVAVA